MNDEKINQIWDHRYPDPRRKLMAVDGLNISSVAAKILVSMISVWRNYLHTTKK